MKIRFDEVHLWYAYDESITDTALVSQYYEMLNKDEKAKMERLYFDRHKHQYLVTRAMVRTVLSLYEEDIPPENWRFVLNEYGKPFIGNSALSLPLCFNISHTEKMVVMAVTLNRDIGVDVEYLPREGLTLELACKFFSEHEVKYLLNLPRNKQKTRFYDLWTLKEAYTKACGMGLSIPLNEFSYLISDSGNISIDFHDLREDDSKAWKFWQVHPNEEHKIAVAFKENGEFKNYTVSMRSIIPLQDMRKVDYLFEIAKLKAS